MPDGIKYHMSGVRGAYLKSGALLRIFRDAYRKVYGEAGLEKASIVRLGAGINSNPILLEDGTSLRGAVFKARKKGENAYFSLLEIIGIAQEYGITEDDVKAGISELKAGKREKYGTLEARREKFESFLREQFSLKDASLVTREQLLSFRRAQLAKIGGLLAWYKKRDEKEKRKCNPYFSLLEEQGYAQKCSITERDLADAGMERSVSLRSIYLDKKARRLVFEAFVRKKYGKGIGEPITKEELLWISQKDFNNKKYREVEYTDAFGSVKKGNAGSLLAWYAKKKPEEGAYFKLLEDLGHAAQYGITAEGLNSQISGKISKGRKTYDYDRIETRRKVFEAFLENMLGAQVAASLTKAHVLGITVFDLQSKEWRKTQHGNASSLYAWYKQKLKGTDVMFEMLRELGYVERFGIAFEEWKASRKRIVVINEKRYCGSCGGGLVLPPGLKLSAHDDTKEMQVIMQATFALGGQDGGGVAGTAEPLINQAVRRAFGNVPIVSDRKARRRLLAARVGSSFAIKSMYPLDAIYVRGLELAGYKVEARNLTFSTGEHVFDSRLKGWHATLVTRICDQDRSLPIMFENHADPQLAMLHALGAYSRRVAAAKNSRELYFTVNAALEWLSFVREQQELPQAGMDRLERAYVGRLGEIEERKMREFGMMRLGESEARKAHMEFAKGKLVYPKEATMDAGGKFQKRLQRVRTSVERRVERATTRIRMPIQ